MEREQHKEIVTKLLGMCAAEHQATASELLTQLSEDYDKTLATVSESSEKIKTLTANNETLRDVNSKLFLRVGETVKQSDTPAKEDTPAGEENKLTFEQLFNDKGDLM